MKTNDNEELNALRRETESLKIQLSNVTTNTNNSMREMEGKLFSMELEMKTSRENADDAR